MTFRLSEPSSLFLDLIRGFAAQAVVVGHGLVLFCGLRGFDWIQNGSVLIFFVLSGFIIPYSTYRKAERDDAYRFRDFFVDRFARIFAGFIPGLLFVFGVDSYLRAGGTYEFESAFDIQTFAGNLLMLQDHPFSQWLAPRLGFEPFMTSFGSGRPFWTVAVEWWIYLLFGWLVLRQRSRVGTFGGLVLLAVFLVVPGWHLIGGRGNGLTMAWLYGLGIYMLLGREMAGLSSRDGVLGTLFFCGVAAVRLRATGEAYDPLFAALVAITMYFALLTLQRIPAAPSWIPAGAIRYHASYTYTLYLVHYTVLVALSRFNTQVSPWLLLAGGFVLSNVIALILGTLFERRYRGFGAWVAARLPNRPPRVTA